MAWITGDDMVRNGVRTSAVNAAPGSGRRRRGSRGVVLGAAVAGILALGACSAEPDLTAATGTPAPAPSASAPVTTDASAGSRLGLEEQEAFDQATAAVLAYRQTIVDLYSGARTRINDLDNVATNPQLDRDQILISQDLVDGTRAEPVGVQVTMTWAESVKVRLEDTEPTVILESCIDGTKGTAVRPDGSRATGLREKATYRVIKPRHAPSADWVVAEMTVPSERTC